MQGMISVHVVKVRAPGPGPVHRERARGGREGKRGDREQWVRRLLLGFNGHLNPLHCAQESVRGVRRLGRLGHLGRATEHRRGVADEVVVGQVARSHALRVRTPSLGRLVVAPHVTPLVAREGPGRAPLGRVAAVTAVVRARHVIIRDVVTRVVVVGVNDALVAVVRSIVTAVVTAVVTSVVTVIVTAIVTVVVAVVVRPVPIVGVATLSGVEALHDPIGRKDNEVTHAELGVVEPARVTRTAPVRWHPALPLRRPDHRADPFHGIDHRLLGSVIGGRIVPVDRGAVNVGGQGAVGVEGSIHVKLLRGRNGRRRTTAALIAPAVRVRLSVPGSLHQAVPVVLNDVHLHALWAAILLDVAVTRVLDRTLWADRVKVGVHADLRVRNVHIERHPPSKKVVRCLAVHVALAVDGVATVDNGGAATPLHIIRLRAI
mmetsp:Transcript_101611/g.291250  ORF Transcript_101611/g.291250 Transcript_101611/m.291250 type:complete len:432 (-) Transcript_101611:144-1439(-)